MILTSSLFRLPPSAFRLCLLLVASIFVSASPVSASAGTLSPNKKTTDILLPETRFATPYYIRDSGKSGPVVLITGGVHGDEPAGTVAAEEIRHWHIEHGRLIVIPRVNIPGLSARQRTMPNVDAGLEDLNRDFPHVGTHESPRGTPATEIWQFVKEQKPTWLVDLHEAVTMHGTRDGSVGNLLLCCPSAELKAAQPELLKAVNAAILDPKLHFSVGRAPKDGSLARAAGDQLGIRAMIIETTKTEQPMAVRVEHHCRIVRALLQHLGMEPGSREEDHR
jgi:predicted deacylase